MLKIVQGLITSAIAIILLAAPLSVAASAQTAQTAAQSGIQYLSNNQNSDGSISGFGGESDWSAMAVEASGQKAAAFAKGGASLLDFLKNNPLPQNASATDIEKRVIAIAATSGNTASFEGVDYNARLASQHNNSQIGATNLLNDDIFGVMAAKAANSSSLQALAQDGLNYMLANQGADGGFSYTTDTCAWCGSDSNDTAAALIALDAAADLGLSHPNLTTAKISALSYLLSTQNADGGFGYDAISPSDGSSTAWSLMALNVIGETVAAPAEQARNWLLQNQNADGGFSFGAYGYTDSDTSTSAHAVIALLGTTWLLDPVPASLSPASPQPQSSPGVQNSGSAPATISPASPKPAGSGTAQATPSNNEPVVINPTNQVAEQPTPAQTTKAVSKSKPDNTSSLAGSNTKSNNNAAYGVIPLCLVAVSWFVLESLKTRRVSYGTWFKAKN